MTTESGTVAPVLRVRDVRAAAAYYRDRLDRLGFDCPEESIAPGVGAEGAIYTIVRRAGVMIHLGRAHRGRTIDPGIAPNAQGAYVYVTDARAVHAELSHAGPTSRSRHGSCPTGWSTPSCVTSMATTSRSARPRGAEATVRGVGPGRSRARARRFSRSSRFPCPCRWCPGWTDRCRSPCRSSSRCRCRGSCSSP